MATELLAAGTTALASTYTVVAADTTVQLMLKPGTGEAPNADSIIFLQFKNASSLPVNVNTMTGLSPTVRFSGPCEYRVFRPLQVATAGASGVDVL